MDVALTQRGTDGALLTITDYLRLAPHQRPTRLWCAGTATHGPCQGPAFPKAVTGAAERGHPLEPRLLGRRDRALAAGRRPRGVTMQVLARRLEAQDVPQRTREISEDDLTADMQAVVMNSWSPAVAVARIGEHVLAPADTLVPLLHAAYADEPAVTV